MKQSIDTPKASFRDNLSKHRLAGISHLYLSDAAERLSKWHNTLIMPILLISKNDDHVVYQLEEAIKRHQHSCLVLNIETQLGPDALAVQHAHEIHNEEIAAPDVCLVPLTNGSTTRVLNSDKLLLAVPSSLPGVRLAYNQLAVLASYGIDLSVQVAMLDVVDKEDAQRFFKFLSNSARNMLGMEIKYCGHITRSEHRESATAATTDDIPLGMEDIAKAILGTMRPRSEYSLPQGLKHKLPGGARDTTTGMPFHHC